MLHHFCHRDPSQGYRQLRRFYGERDAPGFAVGRVEKKLGIRASSTCELILTIAVPISMSRRHRPGQHIVATETLNAGRRYGAQMVVSFSLEAKQHGICHASM